MELDHQLAAAIVARAMHDVGFNLNLMDATGTIIASGDSRRIGTVHQGAVEALRTGHSVETVEDTATEREGINLPFSHGGHPIGVVGITGPLDQVRPLARLVRSTVELLLVQDQVVAERTRTASRRELLAATLLDRSEPVDATVAAQARELGVDLDGWLVVLAPASPVPTTTREAAARQGGLWLRDDLLLCSASRAAALRCTLAPVDVHASSPAPSPGHAVAGARMTRHVARVLRLRGGQDEHHLSALARLAGDAADPACARLDDHPELVETLRAWVRNDLAASAAAADLVVHRNTLAYRMGRIQQLTGRDPRHLPDLIALMAHLMRRA